jgi:hypothetical protein
MARGVVPCYRAVLAAIGLGKDVEVVLSVLPRRPNGVGRIRRSIDFDTVGRPSNLAANCRGIHCRDGAVAAVL